MGAEAAADLDRVFESDDPREQRRARRPLLQRANGEISIVQIRPIRLALGNEGERVAVARPESASPGDPELCLGDLHGDLLSFPGGHLAALVVRPAARGKGVSAAVRGLPAGIGTLTVSRSAQSGSPEG
jgi:hypothetical protein